MGLTRLYVNLKTSILADRVCVCVCLCVACNIYAVGYHLGMQQNTESENICICPKL